MQPLDDPTEYSLRQAAKLLGVHYTTLQRRLRRVPSEPFLIRGAKVSPRKNELGEWRITLPSAPRRAITAGSDRLVEAHLDILRQTLASATAQVAALERLLETPEGAGGTTP